MLYLFEITYAVSFVYALLNYAFDEKFVIVQLILSFCFPFINAFIMATLILFIFELRRLSLLFSIEEEELFEQKAKENIINQRWCIASTVMQALLIGFNNINQMPDNTYLLKSREWQSLIIIFAMIQKIIVDPILFYVLFTSLRFLLNRYKQNRIGAGLEIPSLFYKSRAYLAIVVAVQVSLSILIVLQRT